MAGDSRSVLNTLAVLIADMLIASSRWLKCWQSRLDFYLINTADINFSSQGLPNILLAHQRANQCLFLSIKAHALQAAAAGDCRPSVELSRALLPG